MPIAGVLYVPGLPQLVMIRPERLTLWATPDQIKPGPPLQSIVALPPPSRVRSLDCFNSRRLKYRHQGSLCSGFTYSADEGGSSALNRRRQGITRSIAYNETNIGGGIRGNCDVSRAVFRCEQSLTENETKTAILVNFTKRNHEVLSHTS